MTVHTQKSTLSASRNGGDPASSAPRLSDLQLLTAGQVAKLLGVPRSWVYEQSRVWEQTDGARGIPTVTLGRYRRYRPTAIARYLEALEGLH